MNRKLIFEEILRMKQLMNLKPILPTILLESNRPGSEFIGDIVRYFRGQLDNAPKNKDGTMREVPNGGIIPHAAYARIRRLVNNLEQYGDWDAFVTQLSADEIDFVSRLINSDANLRKKIYKKLVKDWLDEKNRQLLALGGDDAKKIFKGEKDYYRRLKQDLGDRDLVDYLSYERDASGAWIADLFDPVTARILAAEMKPKLNVLDTLVIDDIKKAFYDGIVLEVEGSLKGSQFNPDLWNIDYEKVINMSENEILLLSQNVNPILFGEFLDNADRLSEQIESIRKLFQKLNVNPSELDNQGKELQNQILEAIDRRLEIFYDSEETFFSDINGFLKSNMDKIDKESALYKVYEKINAYDSGNKKFYALSLFDDKIRNRVRAILDGLKLGIPVGDLGKFTARVAVGGPLYVAKTIASWRGKSIGWVDKFFEKTKPKLATFSPEWWKAVKFGSEKMDKPWFTSFSPFKNNQYYRDKYFSLAGQGKYAKYEFFSESVARLVAFKVKLTIVDFIISGFIYTYESFTGAEAQACSSKLTPLVNDLKKQKGYENLSDNLFDIVSQMQLPYEQLPKECQDLNLIDLIALRFAGESSTEGRKKVYTGWKEIILSQFIPDLEKEMTVAGISQTIIQKVLSPGSIDEYVMLGVDMIINSLTEGYIPGLVSDLNTFRDTVAQQIENEADTLDNRIRSDTTLQELINNEPDSTTSNTTTTDSTTTDTLIDDTEQGFKNYLSKEKSLLKFEKWEAAETGYPTSGLPAYGEATDSTAKVSRYEFLDGKWTEIE